MLLRDAAGRVKSRVQPHLSSSTPAPQCQVRLSHTRPRVPRTLYSKRWTHACASPLCCSHGQISASEAAQPTWLASMGSRARAALSQARAVAPGPSGRAYGPCGMSGHNNRSPARRGRGWRGRRWRPRTASRTRPAACAPRAARWSGRPSSRRCWPVRSVPQAAGRPGRGRGAPVHAPARAGTWHARGGAPCPPRALVQGCSFVQQVRAV